jgi:hypothetical protein
MSKPDKPHYVYISHEPDSYKLVIMSKKQEVQELPLTFDLAMKFAKDFSVAAAELHKQEVTRLGNKQKQEDMFTNGEDEKLTGEDSNRTSV